MDFFCRIQLIDTRVHACLYFIAPSGHGLRQLDIQVDLITDIEILSMLQCSVNSIMIRLFSQKKRFILQKQVVQYDVNFINHRFNNTFCCSFISTIVCFPMLFTQGREVNQTSTPSKPILKKLFLITFSVKTILKIYYYKILFQTMKRLHDKVNIILHIIIFKTMKRLHDKVNIIPVVAKSDSCTQGLIHSFRNKLLNRYLLALDIHISYKNKITQVINLCVTFQSVYIIKGVTMRAIFSNPAG